MHETKVKILETTIQILGEEGRGGLTTNELIKRAGISKGALYHHFSSLDDIPLSAFELLIYELDYLIEPSEYDNFEKYLIDLGEHICEFIAKKPSLFKAYLTIFEGALHDHKISFHIEKLINGFYEYMETVVSSFFSTSPSKATIKSISRLICSTIDGMALYQLVVNEDREFKKSWKIFASMVSSYCYDK